MPNFPSIYLELQELWNAIKKVNENQSSLVGVAGGILVGNYPDNITSLAGIDNGNVEIKYGAHIVSGNLKVDSEYSADVYRIDNVAEILSIFNTASVTGSEDPDLGLLVPYGGRYPFPDLTIGQDPKIKNKYHTVQISPGNDPDISSLNVVSGSKEVQLYITSSLQNGTNTHLQTSDTFNINANNSKVIIGSASLVPVGDTFEVLRVGKSNSNTVEPVFMDVTDNSGSLILGYHAKGYGAYVGTNADATAGEINKNKDFAIMTRNSKRLTVLGDGRVSISGSTTTNPQSAVLTIGESASLDYSVWANGNVSLGQYLTIRNNGGGIRLNGSNSPLITRDYNPFDNSGLAGDNAYKMGHGRWGLFMDNSVLALGIPDETGDTVPRWITLSTYETNGTRDDIVAVNNKGFANINAITTINNQEITGPGLKVISSGHSWIEVKGGPVADTGSLLLAADGGGSYIKTSTGNPLSLRYQDAEKIRLSNIGTAITGNVWMYDGNINFASNKGINFHASSNTPVGSVSSISNLLSDYEHGTFAPSLYVNNTFQAQGTSLTVEATYVKVGEMVTILINISSSSDIDFNYSNNTSYLTNIPFLPYSTDTLNFNWAPISFSSFNVAGEWARNSYGHVSTNTLYIQGDPTGDFGSLVPTTGGNRFFSISATYRTK